MGKNIWVLTDDRVGSNNQSIALAERISDNFTIKKISYNSFIKLPNFIRLSSLLGVDLSKSCDIISNDYPDIVICAGRRLSSVALNIKKRSQYKAFVINIMNPNLSYKKFDLLLFPKHDSTNKRTLLKYKNIIETNGNINRVNLSKIKEESNRWISELSQMKKPYFSFIIGGDTKNTKFDSNKFGQLVANLSKVVANQEGTLLVSTSRRTSQECVNTLYTNIVCNHYIYDWQKEFNLPENKKNKFGNPYFAYLGLSDKIIVTGESMSMVSEACSTGKPTYIYMPKESLGKKHKLFCESMINEGFVKKLDLKNILSNYPYEPLNEAERISNIIKLKLQIDE